MSTKAVSDATVPSTGTTSPCRIKSRSPMAISSSGTSSNPPSRCRVAVRGTRDNRSCISRRARPSAKASRNVPPEYMTATTAAARVSPKTNAADIESAATMSRPISPDRRLRRISITNATSAGTTPAIQTRSARSGLSANQRTSPKARPVAASSNMTVFKRSVPDGSMRRRFLSPGHVVQIRRTDADRLLNPMRRVHHRAGGAERRAEVSGGTV